VSALLIAGCQSNATKVENTSAVNLTGIDARVTALMATANVPGLTLAVVEGGTIVYSKAYGMADVDKRTPLTTETVMYGASLTKAAFAYMVMQLVEEGVIDLDLPVTKQLKKLLPSYPDFADLAADPRWMLLTPRMMLAHTTGLINLRWINEDRKLDFKFAPGTRYVYSGEGLQVLQLIVEERTGVPLAVLMQTRVFDRFGMKNTSMVWRDDYVGRHSNRYDEKGAAVGHNQRRRARAAGSMDTTLEDYTRFMAGVFRGEGLQKKSLDEMLRAQIKIVSPTQFPSHFPGTTEVNAAIDLSYGLGWAVYQSPRGPAFFKEGSDTGTDNFALGFPNGQRALVMLSNSSNAKRIFFDISEHVMGKT
jgi:CubicO group peptidase (beta-lactamase class C family)